MLISITGACTRCALRVESSVYLALAGGAALNTRGVHEAARMGRKDSNKSSRRKRDDDSWGDGWEVTHTHTSKTWLGSS